MMPPPPRPDLPKPPGAPSGSPEDLELTIDELAAHTGVPTRTIRFYQAKGVLPSPVRRGRVAVYHASHVERLRLVAELQDRGLRLKAIQDLLKRCDTEGASIDAWLGLQDQLSQWSEDTPRDVSEQELHEMLGERPPGTITRLLRAGAVESEGRGPLRRFHIPSPALLNVALQLEEGGVEIEVAMQVHEMLQKRLSRAADEVVRFLAGRVGDGFAPSAQPEDVRRAVEALRKRGIDAVRIIFSREIDRAVAELLHEQPTLRRRR